MTNKKITIAAISVLATLILVAILSWAMEKSSTNDSCMSCHVHSDSDTRWKQSSHVMNGSGVTTDCAACHLPPKDGTPRHICAKAKAGAKDIFSYIVKNHENIDWDSKGELEYASRIVYNESCTKCHQNLYPQGITDDGVSAHLYYDANAEELNLQCISCHMNVGHFDPAYRHSKMVGVPRSQNANTLEYSSAATVTAFANFTETVPGTTASIRMVAVPGGSFTMGSPDSEPLRGDNEGPQRRVSVSSFWMSECEISWDQYWSFYAETMSEGRTPPAKIYANNSRPDVDAVSGPTPPFGDPSQGWGMGDRPAITMTHYAAETFCQWLSLKTGRTYRLPTEAEWEYAARAGSAEAYPFGGSPRKYSSRGAWYGIFGSDTTVINSYAIYVLNSRSRTQEPSKVRANAFGLKNMLGNVMEYCSDRYAADAYAQLQDGAVDPKGPLPAASDVLAGPDGRGEFVVRGGAYNDDASDLRVAARRSTNHKDWLKTDPQNPKSIWWYSDIKGIGFRIVCEVPETINITE